MIRLHLFIELESELDFGTTLGELEGVRQEVDYDLDIAIFVTVDLVEHL